MNPKIQKPNQTEFRIVTDDNRLLGSVLRYQTGVLADETRRWITQTLLRLYPVFPSAHLEIKYFQGA